MGMGKALLASIRTTRKLTRCGARFQENFQNIATDESLRPANSLGPTAVEDGRVLFSVEEERLARNKFGFELFPLNAVDEDTFQEWLGAVALS